MSAHKLRPILPRPVAFALAQVVLLPVSLSLATAFPFAASGDIAGLARVIDGDTLEIGDRRVRLEGIDAPESAQTCRRDGTRTWACGRVAAEALAALVERRRVRGVAVEDEQLHHDDGSKRVSGIPRIRR